MSLHWESNGFTLYEFLRDREKKARKTPSQCFPNQKRHIASGSKLSDSDVNWLLALVTKISSFSPLPPSVQAWIWKPLLPRKKAWSLIASVVILKPINISLAGTLTLVPLNMLKKTQGIPEPLSLRGLTGLPWRQPEGVLIGNRGGLHGWLQALPQAAPAQQHRHSPWN